MVSYWDLYNQQATDFEQFCCVALTSTLPTYPFVSIHHSLFFVPFTVLPLCLSIPVSAFQCFYSFLYNRVFQSDWISTKNMWNSLFAFTILFELHSCLLTGTIFHCSKTSNGAGKISSYNRQH